MPCTKAVLALLSLLAMGLSLTACSEDAAPPARIGTNVWPGYEPLYLARERGKLPESEIRLVEYPSATEVIRALRNRSLDAAGLTLDEVLVMLAERLPLKVILVMDVSSGADVVIAKPAYRSMQALQGKRIGVESSALGAYMLTRALELNGMTVGDVVVRRLDVNMHHEAFTGGEVDAVVTFEPVRTQLLNAGAVEVFSSAQMPGEIVDVLVVHEDVYRQRPEVFRRLTDAWFDSLAYMETHPEEAARIMARRQKITPAELIESFEGLTLPDRAQNLRMLDGKQATLHATVDMLGRVLLDNNLVRRPVADSSILTAETLR